MFMTQPTLLRKLFESRIIGEHTSKYALSRLIGPLGERQPDSVQAGQNVYRIEITSYTDDANYITDNLTRAESNKKGIPTWGAAGFIPILVYSPNTIYLPLLYRDAGAPTWPDYHTLPSGLSHLINETQEPLHATALREFQEELIFLDKRDVDKLLLNEIKVPYRVHSDGKTRVEVYRDSELVDVAYPFVIGWGTDKDTVVTTVDLSIMFPNLVINDAEKNLQVINGEVVDRKSGRIFSREVSLVDFLGIYRRNPEIKTKRFSIDVDNDKVYEKELTVVSDNMKFIYPLRLCIEKLQSLSEEELSDLLKL